MINRIRICFDCHDADVANTLAQFYAVYNQANSLVGIDADEWCDGVEAFFRFFEVLRDYRPDDDKRYFQSKQAGDFWESLG